LLWTKHNEDVLSGCGLHIAELGAFPKGSGRGFLRRCGSGGGKKGARPAASSTAFAVTGSFVVEKVFAVPGIGQHFVDAVLSKDITLLMGVVLVFSTVVILMNLLVDVLYAWIDPRIKTVAAGS
jgi:hypothetical protein